MIQNAHELYALLHQLSSFAGMLEALRLDAEEKNDFSLFAHLSQGYLTRIRELNREISQYLQSHPEPALPVMR